LALRSTRFVLDRTLPDPGEAGVLTPATAMGAVLADRLPAAGQRLEASGDGWRG